MRTLPLLVAFFLSSLPAHTQQAAQDLNAKIRMVDGDTLTGRIGGVREGNVTVTTEYGVIKVPLTRISAESRKELGLEGVAVKESQLQSRVSELETLVERLRAENAELRTRILAQPAAIQPVVDRVAPRPAAAIMTPPAAAGTGHWISSTGKRHNSGCRYYQTSKGRTGAATEGVACKICGG